MAGVTFQYPFPKLETRDLILRELESNDTADYFALYSDERVMRTWGTPVHQQQEDSAKLIRDHHLNYVSGLSIRWGIQHKQTGRLIGDVGFWRFVKERCRAETGAKLAVDFWSGGLMTQALGRIVEYGFESLGLNTVEANIDPANPAAIRMVEKLGFVREGLLKEHSFCYWRNCYIDTVLFTAHRSRAIVSTKIKETP